MVFAGKARIGTELMTRTVVNIEPDIWDAYESLQGDVDRPADGQMHLRSCLSPLHFRGRPPSCDRVTNYG